LTARQRAGKKQRSMSRNRGAADCGIKHVLEFGALELEFVNFLVGGELNFFLDATNGVVQNVIFLKFLSELVVAQAQMSDGFAMFGEFT
jgi:hypothetical protein